MTECTMHQTEPKPKSIKRLDNHEWCRDCLDQLKKAIKRKLKARGLPSSPPMVAYAMLRVGAEGNSVKKDKRLG